jgi:SAM-dependent methyltransferase
LWLLDLLAPEQGRHLLDISCGTGRLAFFARQRGLYAQGIDLSEIAIRSARTLDVAVVVGNGERLPYPDAGFDYVTHIGSLEHYLHPVLGVAEIARVLKPSGQACILLPNTFSLLGNVWTAWHTGRPFDDGQPIQRYASRYEWQDILEASGLRVFRTVKYERELPRTSSDVGWYLRHPRALARLVLTPLIPLNLSCCFVYLCCRASE